MSISGAMVCFDPQFIVVCWEVIMALLFNLFWWGINQLLYVILIDSFNLTVFVMLVFLWHYDLGSHLITRENVFHLKLLQLKVVIYLYLSDYCMFNYH